MIKPLTCVQCGATFTAYHIARYCQQCRASRVRDADLRRKRCGAARPLGSTDKCAVCGEDYTVTGGNQKYCPDCRPETYKAVDRAGGLKYYKAVKDTVNPARNAKRRQPELRACVICGKQFPHPHTKRTTCSPNCRRLQYNAQMRAWQKNNAGGK